MNDGNRKEFASIMYPFGLLYEIDFNKIMLKLWFEALKEYPIESVVRTVMRYIKSPDYGSYKPKPADLIKMIEGTSGDMTYVAWTKVDGAVRMIGPYESVVFDDPIIHRVIEDMGGWIMLCEKDDKEWPFIAKEFQNRYSGYKKRMEIPEHPPLLTGIHQHDNEKNGLEIQPPRLIGNHNKLKELEA